ncbi:MAG: type II secretion system protein [bacterium]|nr:type II secretion system protein [bacterium]
MRKNKTQKGFTLVELLVAIGIIGILATVVTVSVTQVRARGRDAKRISDINVIKKGLETYAAQRNGYPGVDQEIEIGKGNAIILCDSPTGFVSKEADCTGAVYIKQLPLDQKPNYTGYKYISRGDEGAVCAAADSPCTSYELSFQLEKGAQGYAAKQKTIITPQPK